MHYTYLTLATTVIRTRTHVDRTPLEQFVSNLPFMVIIIGIFILFIAVFKLLLKEEKITDHISEPDNAIGKMLFNSLQQTKAYYKNNRIQMTIIFICAIISCFVGLTVLMISIFISIMKHKPNFGNYIWYSSQFDIRNFLLDLQTM